MFKKKKKVTWEAANREQIEANLDLGAEMLVDKITGELISPNTPVFGETMDDGLKQLEIANKIRNDNREADRKAKSDKWGVRLKIAGLFVSLATFLLMLKQEITGSFRSKGLNWFWDIFKKN